MSDRSSNKNMKSPVDIADEDIFAAMKMMKGYIDITPADFLEIYRFAYNHAVDRISRSVTAGDIMTRRVVSVSTDTSLTETAEKMSISNISGLPVVNNAGKIIGVISEKDFLRKMGVTHTGSFMSVISECLRNKGCLVIPIRGKVAGDIMSTPAVTVDSGRSISDISAIFSEKGINRVPVIDGEDRLIGIVTRGDIVHSFLAKICI